MMMMIMMMVVVVVMALMMMVNDGDDDYDGNVDDDSDCNEDIGDNIAPMMVIVNVKTIITISVYIQPRRLLCGVRMRSSFSFTSMYVQQSLYR